MEDVEQKTGILILAAGASTRMGQPKQLLKIAGESLLQRVLRVALTSPFRPITVVLGANRGAIEPELKGFSVQQVFNPDWPSGMGSSIAVGLSYLVQEEPTLDAVIILVGDQPLLSVQVLLDLQGLSQERKAPLVVSHYADTLGVPALFKKELFEDLKALHGAQGAKTLIQKYQDQAAILDFPAGALDLDTPEDWNAFLTTMKTTGM